MRRKFSAVIFIFIAVFLFISFSLHFSGNAFTTDIQFPLNPNPTFRPHSPSSLIYAIQELPQHINSGIRHVSSLKDTLNTVAVLLPDWEVLVIASPETLFPSGSVGEGYFCLFSDKETSPARLSKPLPSTNQTTFKCVLPNRTRRRLPFRQPVLTRLPETESPRADALVMLRWKFLAYESLSTENDVLLFVKGVNHRQGINRPPHDFRCVFGGDDDAHPAVKTAVTSSGQEVFRCLHPDFTEISYSSDSGAEQNRIKISLEITQQKRVIPSVAYYTPRRMLVKPEEKSLICACTMVHSVSKFLREWVMYHSKIGVEKFILYDNNDEIDDTDDLEIVAEELNDQGYNVEIVPWIWSKSQESGFSHSVVHARKSCVWMMYLDVDEFIFAPSWLNSSHPSKDMMKSMLPKDSSIGQVSIKCNNFGPSNQKSHPPEGVTQGYTCRQRIDHRHKSIVLLEAVDSSLINAIHHFQLKIGYRTKHLGLDGAVVNHYKYQAWSEFKNKFRRRVSAYVVDWTQAMNLNSQDRTPGLGFEPIEPRDWVKKFCEVRDQRLKLLTQKWFGSQTRSGFKLAWQI